jgi:hypothetical protein
MEEAQTTNTNPIISERRVGGDQQGPRNKKGNSGQSHGHRKTMDMEKNVIPPPAHPGEAAKNRVTNSIGKPCSLGGQQTKGNICAEGREGRCTPGRVLLSTVVIYAQRLTQDACWSKEAGWREAKTRRWGRSDKVALANIAATLWLDLDGLGPRLDIDGNGCCRRVAREELAGAGRWRGVVDAEALSEAGARHKVADKDNGEGCGKANGNHRACGEAGGSESAPRRWVVASRGNRDARNARVGGGHGLFVELAHRCRGVRDEG